MSTEEKISEALKLASRSLTLIEELRAAFGRGDIKTRAAFLLQRAARRESKATTARTRYWRGWYSSHAKADRDEAHALLEI